jgi:hypothetical protein
LCRIHNADLQLAVYTRRVYFWESKIGILTQISDFNATY